MLDNITSVEDVVRLASSRPLESRTGIARYSDAQLAQFMAEFRGGKIGILGIPQLAMVDLHRLVIHEVGVNCRSVILNNVAGLVVSDDPVGFKRVAVSESHGRNGGTVRFGGETFSCLGVKYLYDRWGNIITCGNRNWTEEQGVARESGCLKEGMFSVAVDLGNRKRKFTIGGQIVECYAGYGVQGPRVADFVQCYTAKEYNRRLVEKSKGKARYFDPILKQVL